jgi:hypothetical protein
MTINITSGVTITGGVNFSAFHRGLPTTRGIDFSMIDGTPRSMYPSVSLAYVEQPSIWTGKTTSLYPVPTGYSFASMTGIADWSPTVTIDGLTSTMTGVPNSAGISVYNPGASVGEKLMYSFSLDQFNGGTYWDAIGLSDDASVNFNDTYLGTDRHAVAVFDQGSVLFNDSEIVTPNGPLFQSNGKMIDLLVDNDTQRMWYSVDGGPWFGNYAQFTLNASSITNYDGDAGWDEISTFDATTSQNIDFYPEVGDPLLTRLLNAYGDVGIGYHVGIWNVNWAEGSEPGAGYAFVVLYYSDTSSSGYGVYMQPTDITGEDVVPGTYVLPAKFVLNHQIS